MKKIAEIGDVYAAKLKDGRYGAVQVLNRIDKSYLLFVTTYIDYSIPDISDVRLNEILMRVRGGYRKKGDICWHDGPPPKDLIFIGNIPEEKRIDIKEYNAYGGKWSSACAESVLWEWRWINDNENLVREWEEERQRIDEIYRNREQKPKAMMDDDAFWEIISMLDWEQTGDDDAVILPAVTALSKLKVKEIKQFEETMAYKLYLLDTKKHAENLGEYAYSDSADSSFSEDGFLYTRCVVVANGKDFFEKVLNNPTLIPGDLEFESLLYIASTAYEQRTGKDFKYETGCDYETYSNRDGWTS